MYSHCLFCNRDLGRNEALEAFPVGRRLAYDAVKGRLWVVCPACARWNLTPLEERWEAVEQAERLFRGTRLRASTDNVGLARVADGTHLVRIGAPLRPEFAAWRYRPTADRRRLAAQALTIGGLAVGGALALAVGVAGPIALAGTAFGAAARLGRWMMHGVPFQTAARLRTDAGGELRVRRRHLLATRFVPGSADELALEIAHEGGVARVGGADALRAAAVLLPASNWLTSAGDNVGRAVRRLEGAGGPEQFLRDFARRGPRLTTPSRDRRREQAMGVEAADPGEYDETGLLALEPSLRLAVEMALHEDRERRALDGELADLERAWRDAEAIAAIADDLLLPGRVQRALIRLRGAAPPGPMA